MDEPHQRGERAPENVFGPQLRRARLAVGLTQEALAERAGLTPNAIGALERGTHRHPYPATIRALAAALHLTDVERAALAASVPSRGQSDVGAASPSPVPVPLSSLIGREREIAEVSSLLREGNARLVTLTGPGGVGKTRLALQAAASLAGGFAHGAAFVSLSAVQDPALVPSAIAQALKVRETGHQPWGERLGQALRDRHLLLVLDNYEHVLEAAALVADLLGRCPRLTVLVTSRAPLRLDGERAMPVPPLAAPDPEHRTAAERLADFAAVQLFVERAQAANPGFALTEENAGAVAAICHRLDGLPLAIELAAAQSSLFAPSAMLARLARRLPLLMAGRRDAPARHRTMRDAIAWSHDLLEPEDQAVFRRLAVFVGGFSLEAAETVAGDREQGLLANVAALAEHQLLNRVDDSSTEPRFAMLETIREYALERLIERDEEPASRNAHAGWCLALAARIEAARSGLSPALAADPLRVERANLRAALRWLHERRDIERGLRLAGDLWPLWLEQGGVTEGRASLASFLALPGAGAHRAVWAKAMGVAGALAQAQGQHDQAVAFSERALAVCRDLGDPRAARPPRSRPLGLSRWCGATFRARVHLEASAARFRKAGDPRAGAWALRHLSSLAYRRGDLREAAALAEEGLALVQVSGRRADAAGLLHNLEIAAAAQGDVARAMALWDDGLALHQAADDSWGVADALGSLGDAARWRGDWLEAGALLAESLSRFREIGDPEGIAIILGRLGWLARAQGDRAQAAQRFEEGLTLAYERGATSCVMVSLLGLGAVALDQGSLASAATLLKTSLRLAQTLADQLAMASALERFGHLAAAAGDAARGAELLGAAGALRETLGAPPPPPERAEHEGLAAALRIRLGATAFVDRLAAGRTWTRDERVAAALSAAAVSFDAAPTDGQWLRFDKAIALANEVTGAQAAKARPERRGAHGLTPREHEVLREMATGRSNRDIADALFIEKRTIDTHVEHILAKLDVETRTAAVAFAIHHGLA